jgi:hypothetical protein
MTQITVGIRELKARLRAELERLKSGKANS